MRNIWWKFAEIQVDKDWVSTRERSNEYLVYIKLSTCDDGHFDMHHDRITNSEILMFYLLLCSSSSIRHNRWTWSILLAVFLHADCGKWRKAVLQSKKKRTRKKQQIWSFELQRDLSIYFTFHFPHQQNTISINSINIAEISSNLEKIINPSHETRIEQILECGNKFNLNASML